MSAAESTRADASQSNVYPLKFPIKLTGKDGEVVEEITELTLKRLKGGAARRVLNAQQKGPGDFAFVLICESASIPPSTFDKLDAEDVLGLMEAAAPFLGNAPPQKSD